MMQSVVAVAAAGLEKVLTCSNAFMGQSKMKTGLLSTEFIQQRTFSFNKVCKQVGLLIH